jgi:hypothetical protein
MMSSYLETQRGQLVMSNDGVRDKIQGFALLKIT